MVGVVFFLSVNHNPIPMAEFGPETFIWFLHDINRKDE